jgi:tetratricopeptide (TPR) repeat protein
MSQETPASANDDTDPKRAVDFFRRGDFEEALRRADEIVKIGPQVALSWRFKGECLFSLQRYFEAVDCFDKASALGGDGTEELFLWKALSLYNDGKPEQAKQVIGDFLASGAGSPDLREKAQKALAKLSKRWWQFWR